jgi:hypothetical protein
LKQKDTRVFRGSPAGRSIAPGEKLQAEALLDQVNIPQMEFLQQNHELL